MPARKKSKPDPERRRQLTDAVLASPADDAPRLVLADWLIEHGDPRGEFIALQCAAAKVPYEKQSEHEALYARAAELHKRYSATWTPFFRGLKVRPQYHFHRGFIATVRFRDTERLDTVVGELLAREPVDSLTLEGLQGDLEAARRTFALPRMAAIEELSAIGYNVEARLAELLVEAPALSGLRTLVYGHFGGDRAAELLARSTHFTRLKTLVLTYAGFTDAAAVSLAGSSAFPELVELNLSNNKLTDAGAQALVTGQGLARLKRLSVRANPAITEPGRAALRERFALW